MMLTDCMNELGNGISTAGKGYDWPRTHMFPPNNLICKVTTASPIQTIEKTPEKTKSDCARDARIDKNMLNKRQKISGPLSTHISNHITDHQSLEPTKDPSPGVPRSYHPAAARLRQAIVPQGP